MDTSTSSKSRLRRRLPKQTEPKLEKPDPEKIRRLLAEASISRNPSSLILGVFNTMTGQDFLLRDTSDAAENWHLTKQIHRAAFRRLLERIYATHPDRNHRTLAREIANAVARYDNDNAIARAMASARIGFNSGMGSGRNGSFHGRTV